MVRRGAWIDRKFPQVNLNLTDSDTGNHPVAVAAVASASTIGLMLLLFNEVILPIRTDNLEEELGSLNREAIQLRSEVADKAAQIHSLNAELKYVRDQLYELQTASLFNRDNPFPLGLRNIRPGSTKKQLEASFVPNAIDKTNKEYWTVKLDHSTFDTATYYFKSEGEGEAQTVSHIAYSLPYDHQFGDDFLQKKLVDALGAPRQWSLDEFYSWETKRRTVYKRDPDFFIVTNKGMIPALWPVE